MLQLSGNVLGLSVLSLRTGQPVATITKPVFNPNNLKLEGFYCNDSFSNSELILLYQDIRELVKNGFVVNDHDVLVEPDELIRLQDIIELDFELLGKQIATVSGHRVGKVSDYAIETETMFVQKIYASQSLLKSLTGGTLSIDRTQIQEITAKKIIIADLLDDTAVPASAAIG